MISAINNTEQNYINFGRKKAINTKKITKAFKELPYTLGIKKKKNIFQKIAECLTPKKKSIFKF